MFEGKILLITGGTGSFGNAVLNRFLTSGIREIRIVSRDEKKQDDMRHAYQLEYPSEWPLLSAGSLTTAAFGKLPFWGDEILAVAILCFALATLVGWSYLGRQGFDYLFCEKKQRIYQTIYITMIFIGGVMPLNLVWEMTDFINLFLLLPTVYLLIRCRSFFEK